MKKLLSSLFLFFVGVGTSFSQQAVNGNVSDKSGVPLLGVTVLVQGTVKGSQTDFDGNYKISAKPGDVILFSYVGMASQEVKVAPGQTRIDIQLQEDAKALEEVVVTALGIEREKKALGYAVQKVASEDLVAVKTGNIANSLSGKVAGLNVKRNSNFGGSTNIVIRGYNSLSGDSQALFVVDGIPISNRNSNSLTQSQASAGYDYGNSGMDVNPEDVESVEILKGGAASALYGSLAANGVVMITTKKGKEGKTAINISSTTTVGLLNKSTFASYQDKYGAGYGLGDYDGDGGNWYVADINGDGIKDDYALITEDASYGAPFDGRMVYQWNSLYPELSTYHKKTPWVAAKNGPLSFFQVPITLSNTVSLQGGNDKIVYRLSYTRFDQNGALPNSKWDKDNISFSSSYKFNDKFSVSTSVNYTYQNVIGRNGTGYNGNLITGFRQWWQTNVDIKEQERAYKQTGKNISWNPKDPDAAASGDNPIFWNNPYYERYQNYESDNRGRWIANLNLDYKFVNLENTKITGVLQLATDTYGELQEERLSIGSVPQAFGIGTGTDGSYSRPNAPSGYLRRDLTSRIMHYNLIVNFKQKISEDVGLSGLVGATMRSNYFNRIISATNGGLDFPDVYSLQNSKNALIPSLEASEKQLLNGVYANAIFDYKSLIYLDMAIRTDQSSSLPSGANTYAYPSVSASFIFSELIKNNPVLSFGKFRANVAQVGNATGFDLLRDSYAKSVGVGGASLKPSNTKRNSDLRPERQTAVEFGLETKFFKNKLGLDVAVYQNNTRDQIAAVSVSTSTGYPYKYVNAGEIQNRGIEISLSGNDINLGPVKWSSSINWSKNQSEVLSLAGGAKTYQLGSFPGGVTINAVVGQPFGTIYGTDFVYKDGQKVVNPKTGYYEKTSNSDNALGSQIPTWIMGFRNTFVYKNVSLGFLIDTQYGGKVFSLDMYYGLSSGLYPETAYTNDLGNPVRNPVAEGGGYINPGVYPDGTKNTTRANASNYYGYGYETNPNAAFVYDASYVKLRELSVGYDIPFKNKKILRAAKVSFVGSNLFIFYKNLPYADPENGLGSGALQAYSIGSLPSFRELSFNVSLSL